MTDKVVAIVDYGFGNVRSVVNALESSGLVPRVVSRPSEVIGAEDIVLPGVGAFATAMRVIVDTGLDEAIRQSVRGGAHVLGICLGMQLLFGSSLEFGEHAGLGILEGTVRPLVPPEDVSPSAKSTHIAWTSVGAENSGRLSSWFTSHQHEYYFVHSFSAQPIFPEIVAGTAHYLGVPFVAAVERGNTAGVQFHPERSGDGGLALLSHFFDRKSQPAGHLSPESSRLWSRVGIPREGA